MINTKHAKIRFKERTDFASKDMNKICKLAIKNGLSFKQLPKGNLKKYLSVRNHKRIKIYQGFIFFFFKTSNRLITIYPIPEQFLEEYKKILKSS